jgi:trehalose 6-phosphate synthase/phosphatase
MRAMRERVFAWDDTRWAQGFLRALDAEDEGAAPRPARYSAPEELEALVARARASERCVLLLDYDGTLVPFAPAPELALPDPALRALLRRLCESPGLEVHVVSGRGRESLERWLGDLPLVLHAEHGALVRRDGVWEERPRPADPSRERVLGILREFAERTPGARVEEKETCLSWHYRGADAEYGERQARELEVHLRELLSNLPVEVIQGAKVIEVRPQGVHKGLVVADVAELAAAGGLLIAIGDDRTDQDLFAALPPGGVAVHVGEGESKAPLRVIDTDAVRELLARLVG